MRNRITFQGFQTRVVHLEYIACLRYTILGWNPWFDSQTFSIPWLFSWSCFCVFRGRLKHGRHFTFKSVMNDVAVTLVSPRVVGSITDEEHPFAAHGTWLQVLIREDFLDKMISDLEELSYPDEVSGGASQASVTVNGRVAGLCHCQWKGERPLSMAG